MKKKITNIIIENGIILVSYNLILLGVQIPIRFEMASLMPKEFDLGGVYKMAYDIIK